MKAWEFKGRASVKDFCPSKVANSKPSFLQKKDFAADVFWEYPKARSLFYNTYDNGSCRKSFLVFFVVFSDS